MARIVLAACIVVALQLIAPVSAQGQFPKWNRISSGSIRLEARSSHMAVYNSTHVIMVGGETSDGTFPTTNVAYNYVTNEVAAAPAPSPLGNPPYYLNRNAWAQWPGMNKALSFSGRAPSANGGALYTGGGMFEYDVSANQINYRSIAPGSPANPSGREFSSGTWMSKCNQTSPGVFDGCFAFFGGFGNGVPSNTAITMGFPRTVGAGTSAIFWVTKAITGPVARWSTMAGVSPAGDVLYLIGGDTAAGSVNEVWAFAPFGFPDLRAGEYNNLARTLAPAVKAYQSSEYTWAANGASTSPASRGIDGNPSTVWGSNSCGQTNANAPNTTNPWWGVDLGSVQTFDNIRIYQRTDCCRGRNAGYRIFTSNTRSALEWQGAGVTEIPAPSSDILGSYDDVPGAQGKSGRFIWFMLPGPNRIITMCEFEVWKRKPDVWRQLSGTYNAALIKPAFMSSKDNNAEENQLGGDANQCTDGNIGGRAPDWCKTSGVRWSSVPPGPSPRVFLYVDLGFEHDIFTVGLVPRSDSPAKAARQTRLEVYTGNSRQFEGCTKCWGPSAAIATAQNGAAYTITCPSRGRFVHVRRVPLYNDIASDNVLEMAELIVNGNRLTNQPSARSGAAYSMYGGYLVMFGGRDKSGVQLNDVRLFDTISGVWMPPITVYGTPPLARSYATLTTLPNVVPGGQFAGSPSSKLLLFGGVGPESALSDLATLSFASCPMLQDTNFASLTCSHSDTVCYYTCLQGTAAHANGGRPLRCGLDGAWVGIKPYCIDQSRIPPDVGAVTLIAGVTNATIKFKALVPAAGYLPVTKYMVQARTNAYVQQFTSAGFMDPADWNLWTPYRNAAHVYGFEERSLFMNLENAQDCWGARQYCMIITRSIPTSVVPTVNSNWAVETYVAFEVGSTYVPLDNNQFGLTLFDGNETRWSPAGTTFRGQSEIFAGIRRAGRQYQVGWEATGSRWSYWVNSGGKTFAWIRLERQWDPVVAKRMWRFGFKFDVRDAWTFVYARFENTLDRGQGDRDLEYLPAADLRVGLMGKNGQGLKIRAYARFEYFRIAPIECADTGIEGLEVTQPAGAVNGVTDVSVVVPGLDGSRPYVFSVKAYNDMFWSRNDAFAPTQTVGQPTVYTTVAPEPVVFINSSLLVEVARNRPVAVSSQSGANNAALAIDGDLNTMFHSRTGNITGEWLQVDLGIQTAVKQMRLTNRPPDGPCPFCPDRLTGYQVFVSPTTYFTDSPVCSNSPFNITMAQNGYPFFWNATMNMLRIQDPAGQRNVDLSKDFAATWDCPQVGRYVTVRVPPNQGIGGRDGYLHFRDLKVYASNSCPPRSTHFLAEQVVGTVCTGARLGSVCAQKCKPGYVAIAGEATSKCNGENWDAAALVCTPECPALAEPAYAETCERSIFSENFNALAATADGSSQEETVRSNLIARWESYFPQTQGFGNKWFVARTGDAGDAKLYASAAKGCDDELYAEIADAKVSGHRAAFTFSAVIKTRDRAGLFFRSLDRQNMYRVYADVLTRTVALDVMLGSVVTRLNDLTVSDQILNSISPYKLSVAMEGVLITVKLNGAFLFYSQILDRTLLAGAAGMYAGTNATFDDVLFNVPCVGSVAGATNGDVATFTCQAGLYAEGPLTRTCTANSGGLTADWVQPTTVTTLCRLSSPVMIPQTLFVNENVARNALVGNPITATIDSPDFQLQFKIDACDTKPIGGRCTATTPFFIDACTGQVKVRAAVLNFEYQPTYILSVRAFVPEFASSSFTVLNYTVQLVDVDEPPIVSATIFYVKENSLGGTIIGTVPIADPENSPFAATIELVSPGGVFYDLAPATGVITVKAGAKVGDLNYENLVTQTSTMVVLATQLSNTAL